MSWKLVIITGASRGYGRAIAVNFAKSSTNPVHFILSGRNSTDLNTTADIIKSVATVPTECETKVLNLNDTNSLEQSASDLFSSILFNTNGRSYENRVYFINNAASLGSLATIGSLPAAESLADMIATINFNVTSACFLSWEIVRRFKQGALPSSLTELYITNVSSLAAVQPFSSMALYSTGKAARDMYHRVLAEEQQNSGTADGKLVKVLNWAPGPMETDMTDSIATSNTVDPGTATFFKGLKKDNKFVNKDDSAAKMWSILEKSEFISGSHVDFFDDLGVDVAKAGFDVKKDP